MSAETSDAAALIEAALREHLRLKITRTTIEHAQRGWLIHLSGGEAEDAARIAVEALTAAGLVIVPAANPDDFPPLPSEVIADVLVEDGADEDTARKWSARIMVALIKAGYLVCSGAGLPVTRWNSDKPHRCPYCHDVAIRTGRPRWWRVYTCHRCEGRFTRWPVLARLLPHVDVQRSERQTSERNTDD